MSGSIEERVVAMHFDNAQFEQGVHTTLDSLDKLNKSLKLEGAAKGLNDLSEAGKQVQLGHIAGAVSDISERFKLLSVAAITTFSTIVSQALHAGYSLAKSLTVEPINAGLQEYQTNINSIQTILSNTRWQNTGLNDVTKALDILNRYSDQTIYNFTEMARNIGTFTAAGVKLDVAVNAIKGIANLAAVSGSSSEQASVAMYQLSQAIATGTVKLIDWNSVVNAGLGGKVFQDALIETARVHGVAVDSMIKDAGSFRATLEKGWLTASILTETLSHFTGDLNEKQLLSLGYSKEQAKSIVAMGLDAQNAATKVKTITQLLSTLRESAGSGWTQTWALIFGNFEEARDLFTNVNNVLSVFVQSNADARNKILGDWKALGGRLALIDAIGNSFNALIAILRPIRQAFQEMFPSITGQQLADFSRILKFFTEDLLIADSTADKLRRSFAGLFAIFGIVWDITKKLAGTLFNLFGFAAQGSGDILTITANLGDFLVALRKAINEGDGLARFFQGLTRFLEGPIKVIKILIHLIAGMFDGFDPEGAANKITGFVKDLNPLAAMAQIIIYAWGGVIGFFGHLWDFFEPFADKIVALSQDVSNAIGGVNFSDLLSAINTGALVSFVVIVRNLFGKKQGIAGVLGELTETLGAMQTTLHATTLLEIALAIGVLAVSISVLSKIDSQGLTKSLAAISVMFTQLMASLFILSKLPKTNILRLYVTAAALSAIAVAIDILTIAVKQLASINTKDLHKGLIGVGLLMASLTISANYLPDGARLISTGLGLLVLSAAIKVLASAVTDLSGLSWEEMAKGLTGVGGLLLALTLFSRFAEANVTGALSAAGIVILAAGIKILASAMLDISKLSWEEIGKGLTVVAGGLAIMAAALNLIPPSSVISAVGVLIVAASLEIISDALGKMGDMRWETILKGLVTMAGALAIIGLALDLIPPTAPIVAAGILIVAISLEILADAIQKMGAMSWEAIAKGLVVLAGSLAIITAALYLMPAAIPGALALLLVSGALTILAGVLVVLGNMSWGEIGRGLATLAGAFLVLGIAGALMTPVIPTLLGLGLAITLIGAGLALAGAGVFLFAAGLTALSIAGAAGAAAIVAIISAVIGLIPTLIKQVGIGLLLLIDILIDGIPKIVELIIDLIIQLLDGLDEILPKLAVLVIKLIELILLILVDCIPKMVDAGYKILIGILEGIRANVGRALKAATELIVAFLKGIGQNLPKLQQAGVDLIIDFMDSLGKTIDNNSERMAKAGANLAFNIVKGIIKGLKGAVMDVVNTAVDLAKKALNAVDDFLGINSPSKEFEKRGVYSGQGLASGFVKSTPLVSKSAEGMGNAALMTLKDALAAIYTVVDSDFNLVPTISPVLDLTNLKKDADKIPALMSSRSITVNTTYSSAKDTSTDYDENRRYPDDPGDKPMGDTWNFTQNNTSPKALSTAEIYRQTKNQLASAKGVLPN